MDVHRNDDLSRYELHDDGSVVAVAEYVVRGDTVVLTHTEVDPRLRGAGLGAVVVKAALDDVRAAGHSIVPECWFVARYVEANPAYRDLLAA